MPLFRRFRAFEPRPRAEGDAAGAKDDGTLDIRASTDEPVSMGNWFEVLEHGADCVDASSARALLVNHNPNQIAGPLNGAPSFDGHSCDVRASILPDARLQSNVSVRAAVDSGALRGVSIGYGYDMADTEWDGDQRILRVKRWSLREVSLTPIPADLNAQVRSLPDEITNRTRNIPMPDPVNPDAVPPVDVAAERAAMRTEAREIAVLARSVGLNADDFVGMPKADAQVAMLAARAKKDAEKQPDPEQPITPAIRMGQEHVEKQRDAFAEATLARNGFKGETQGNPYAGKTILDQVRAYVRAVGIRGSEDWSRKDLAHFALNETSQISGFRDAANIINANFASFVVLNAVTKVVLKGYEMGASQVQYQRISTTQVVPDFKTYYLGALGTGNLQLTPENVAFPELIKSEGVYNDAVKMWGGTLSLTLQALLNDDTGQFDRSLRSAGMIAQKTKDRRVFQKLLLGTSATSSTWTSNTTSGCSPVWTTADTLAAARAKVNLGIIALMNKVGLDGNPLGTQTRFLVGGPTVGAYLAGLQYGAPGQTVGNAYAGQTELVISQWMEASALSGYSTTTFYALGDPEMSGGLVVSQIAGYESPQVQEYDAGAVGARKWKVWQPFEADLPYLTVGSTATIASAQQCTT